MANPNEDELLTFLADFEQSAGNTIRKGGDALQSASHDGGFATQGTNIQSKGKLKKAIQSLMKGGFSKEEAEEIAKKGFGGDDDDASSGEDDASGDVADESSSDDGDSASDAEPPMNKSTGAAQLANATQRGGKSDTLRKALTDEHPDTQGALDAAPILGQLIDAIDRLAKSGGNVSKKELGDIRKSVVQVQSTQNEFNGKIAKALSMIAGRVISTETLIKKIASEPVNAGNRAPTLRKGDLQEPQFHNGDQAKIGGNGGTGEPSPLMNIDYYKIQETLADICMKGGADLMDITKFENAKGNLAVLPPNVIKQLEQRLCAA